MKNKFYLKFGGILLAFSFAFTGIPTAFAKDTTETLAVAAEVSQVETTSESTEPTTELPTESTQPTNPQPTEPVISYKGLAGNNLNYSFNENSGTLTIKGSGTEIFSYTEKNPAPWSYFADKITSVNLLDAYNLNTVGSYAFANLTKMKEVYLSESLSTIGERAFLNTYNLSSLILEKNIKLINKGAFENSGVKTLKFMNPNATINGGQETIPPTTKIKAFKSSTAYKYAKKYLRTFYMMISEISFTETHDVITKGEKYTPEYKLNPSNPTNGKLKWYTTNKKIATINSKGVVTPKKVGTCYIYAKATDGSRVISKQFKINVTDFKLNKYIFTNNNCYKECTAIDPKGIIVHSTGAVTPRLRSFIPNWNVPKPGGREVCVHGFVGIDNNGKVATYQTLPFEMAAWGCGSGSKGSFNYNPGYIQFECCEDNLTSRYHFNRIYEEATDFCAYLCLKYCLSYKQVDSHAGANAKGYASAHGDIDHWLRKYGLTMNDLRKTVKKKIYAIDPNPDLKSGSKHKKLTVKRDTELWSKRFVDEYGNGSKKKLTIKKGSTVSFLNDAFCGWSKVSINGVKGYVKNKDINLPYASKYVTLKLGYGVKCYTKPSTKAKYYKGTFKAGTKVKQISRVLSGSKKNWRLISYKGKEYYIKNI